MAGIDLGGILRERFWKDPSELSDKELAEKVEAIKAAPKKETVSYEDLLAIPQDEWKNYDVQMVRIVSAEGVEPCELCAPLIGKCFTLVDGRFYLNHGRANHRAPFCLDMVPAYQVFHKWAEEVYGRDQAGK